MSFHGALRRAGSHQHLCDPAKAVGKSARQRPAIGIALLSLRQSRLRFHRIGRLPALSRRSYLAVSDGVLGARAYRTCTVARETASSRNKAFPVSSGGAFTTKETKSTKGIRIAFFPIFFSS